MSAVIRFGNGTIDQIEKSLGIEFTEGDRQLLQETHSAATEFTGPRQWHLFTHPKVLVFSSMGFYKEFQKLSGKYEMDGNLEASFETWENESVDYHFRKDNKNVHESGFPKFLAREELSWTNHYEPIFSRRLRFLQLAKVNSKTLVYLPVPGMSFFKDILRMGSVLMMDDIEVPKELTETELKAKFKMDPYAREVIPKTLFEERDALTRSKFKDKISISFFDGHRDTSSRLSIVKEWEKDWRVWDNYTTDVTSVDELLSVRSLKSDAKKLMKEFKEAI